MEPIIPRASHWVALSFVRIGGRYDSMRKNLKLDEELEKARPKLGGISAMEDAVLNGAKICHFKTQGQT